MTKKSGEKSSIAYKGFDHSLKCRGFQYEIGKSYALDSDPVLCEKGFHACEYPLDVFGYYEPGKSIYAKVEQSGKVVKDNDKTTSSKISITAAISIAEIVSASIEYTTERCNPSKKKHATRDRSAASATGDQSAASATGYQSAASTTGTGARHPPPDTRARHPPPGTGARHPPPGTTQSPPLSVSKRNQNQVLPASLSLRGGTKNQNENALLSDMSEKME